MKNKKIINHKFLNRYTVIGAVLLMAWGFVFAEIIFPLPFGVIAGFMTSDEGTLLIVAEFAAVIGALLALAIHKRWFYPEYKGCLGGSGFTAALRVSKPILPFWILTMARELIAGHSVQPLTLSIIATALMAGFCGEAAFRGIGVSYLMRQWKSEEKIPYVVALTSVCFALMHSTNIFSGAALGVTLLQIVAAGFIGVFLCGVFLRSGNLWVPIIIHTLHDVISLLFLPEGAVLTHAVEMSDWLDLGLTIALGAAGLYMVRKSKRGEIIALWQEKWSGVK